MNADVLRKLEFGEIVRRLSTHCQYSVAAVRALELTPSPDRKIVRARLDVTAEASDLLVQFPEMSIGGARDIRDQLEKAEKGGRLMPAELLTVMDTLRAGRELRRLFTRLPDAAERYPRLLEFAEAIENFSPLETDLTRSIGPRGDVLDAASAELAQLRRAVRVAHSRLMDRLNSFVSGGRFGSALQENIITIRDGRYVVPVKAEARGLIRGIVHDTSASGHTLFVEPFDVVELNNRWREHQLAEEREIERILDDLSQKVGGHADGLRRMIEAIASIDLAMAKAKLAVAMQATRPRLHEPGSSRNGQRDSRSHPTHLVRLDLARHPLLPPDSVVPVTLELGRDFRVLLITGPNTGGKTVALKTVGLLTLMAQAGLYIPADDTSIVSVFSAIHVDIGDEQSIEQSLSTFSSHMRNIIRMLRTVKSDQLVLLDEVGAGTDPQEGSALARALMNVLLRRQAMVVATTHYSEVKAFAYATNGVENASVEFDVNTLSPTYRLMVGVPGRSNALSIARRLGMPAEVIDEAQRLLEPGEGQTEQLIDDIRDRRNQIGRELDAARQAQEETRLLRRRAAQSIREADEIRQRAREEAIAEVQAELAEARTVIRELERARTATGVPQARVVEQADQIRAAEQQLKHVQRKRLKPAPVQTQQRVIRLGDRVKLTALDQEGEVLAIEGDEADVQMGSLKLRQPLRDLERLGRVKREEPRVARMVRDAISETVPIEIDIRGNRVDEIGPVLDRYIEDAYLTGLPWVRIIHGKGTGALRQVVREFLRDNPAVAQYEAAGAREGGEGATVAKLRQT